SVIVQHPLLSHEKYILTKEKLVNNMTSFPVLFASNLFNFYSRSIFFSFFFHFFSFFFSNAFFNRFWSLVCNFFSVFQSKSCKFAYFFNFFNIRSSSTF